MQESIDQQLFFMRWAIHLSQQGRITAPPNPWVGCVLVKDREIVGEGYHVAAGKPHAEVVALEKAGHMAKGATAYVTLEPCAHHGRTPPCVDALIEAKIKKVIVALEDPDPKVSGKGIARLKEAGIEVVVGVAQDEAAQVIRPYLHQRKTGRAYCVIKSAASLDGRTAAADGSSRWITGEEARADVHRLRAESQAIIIGSQTALLDNPRLDVRGISVEKQPLRVLIDSQGKVPPKGHLADLSIAPTLVWTNSSAHQKIWEDCGATVQLAPFDPQQILTHLASMGVIQALVEGGSTLHTTFLPQANQLVVYYGNCLLGEGGKPMFSLPINSIQDAPRFQLEHVYRFGNDVRLDFLSPQDVNY